MDDVLNKLYTEIQIADYHGKRRIEIDVGLLKKILAILTAHKEIIRCHECKHYKKQVYDTNQWLPCMSVRKGKNWYCADAERG